MSRADKLFVTMCERILKDGYSSEGQSVRARWRMELRLIRSRALAWSTVMIFRRNFRR